MPFRKPYNKLILKLAFKDDLWPNVCVFTSCFYTNEKTDRVYLTRKWEDRYKRHEWTSSAN